MGLACVAMAMVLLCAGIAACGDGDKSYVGSATAVATTRNLAGSNVVSVGGRRYLLGDRDDDDIAGGYADHDDNRLRGYGQNAGKADMSAVTALIRRYYASAASGNGAQSCSLVAARITEGSDFSRVVPAEYVPASGSSVFSGKTCAQVSSLLFQIDHERLVGDATALRVTGLRVRADRGIAFLGFSTSGERQIVVVRDGGVWKLDALLDSALP